MYSSLSFVPVGQKLAIPQLPPCPNRKEVREYLEWLAASEFCYHLDDAASECGFPKEAGRILEENAEAMFSQFDDAHIWAIYWPLDTNNVQPALDPEYKRYLDKLRKSGKTNMFGAGAYVQRQFGVDRREASAIVAQWMREFTPENDTARKSR